jgi:hypothetical protein
VHGGGTCGPGRANMERKKGGMSALELRSQVPDADENSIQASGKANGRVKRGTAEYDALITNTNPDIIFKEDVGTGDNRRMTKVKPTHSIILYYHLLYKLSKCT